MQPLAGNFAAIVYQGADWQKRYAVKFRARRAIVLHAMAQGWSFDWCEKVLLDPANLGSSLWLRGEDDRELGRTTAFRRLDADWKACERRRAESPAWKSASDVRQALGLMVCRLEETHMPGRTRHTDKAVLRAAISIATQAACDEPDLPIRDVATLAGVATKTASRSLARLCRAGWLVRVKGSGSHHGTHRFKLCLSHRDTYDSLRGRDYMGHSETPSLWRRTGIDPGHETWLRLGKSALAIWSTLDLEYRSAPEIAKRAEVGRATAYRQLPILKSYRLAIRSDDGWSLGPAEPADVQKDMGWYADNSIAERRRVQIEVERDYQEQWRKAGRLKEAA